MLATAQGRRTPHRVEGQHVGIAEDFFHSTVRFNLRRIHKLKEDTLQAPGRSIDLQIITGILLLYSDDLALEYSFEYQYEVPIL